MLMGEKRPGLGPARQENETLARHEMQAGTDLSVMRSSAEPRTYATGLAEGGQKE